MKDFRKQVKKLRDPSDIIEKSRNIATQEKRYKLLLKWIFLFFQGACMKRVIASFTLGSTKTENLNGFYFYDLTEEVCHLLGHSPNVYNNQGSCCAQAKAKGRKVNPSLLPVWQVHERLNCDLLPHRKLIIRKLN